jgi:hypothetical protein
MLMQSKYSLKKTKKKYKANVVDMIKFNKCG